MSTTTTRSHQRAASEFDALSTAAFDATDPTSLELAPVRVNLVADGFVDTPLSASLLGDELENRRNQLRSTLPIGCVVTPADVAALAVRPNSRNLTTSCSQPGNRSMDRSPRLLMPGAGP